MGEDSFDGALHGCNVGADLTAAVDIQPDDYWKFHLSKERHRVHETRYACDTLPVAA
mgnify:CR=1 FL=1